MNRIYQGRVSKVEISDGKDKSSKPLNLDVFWRHHELFQDAVNYYVVCLLALARPGNPIYPIREKLDAHDENGNPDDLMVWRPFRRRGATRSGLRDSVAKYLTPDNDHPTPDDCFAAVLAGNEAAKSEEGLLKLDAGLRQLLIKCTGDSGCRNAAPEYLPRLCKPDYRGNYGEDTAALLRENAKARFPFVLHASTTRFDSPELDEFGVHSIALPNERKPSFTSSQAKEKLKEMVSAWRVRQPDAESNWTQLDTSISKLPDNIEIPGYAPTSAKGEVKFRLFAMFLFRHVEKSAFILDLLQTTTPKPATNESMPDRANVGSGGDPIRLVRGHRGYVFRAFTSLLCWSGDAATGTPRWIEFDCAAFEEALKALHQVDAKADERQKARELLLAQHNYQRGKAKKWKATGAGEEDQRPPFLVGDPRIARLEELLSKDRKSGGLAEEYEMAEGVAVEYGLQQRTIRGFRDVRKKWNETLQPDDQYTPALREKLWNLLTEYKKGNAQTIGSPVLFDAMVEEVNWIIWREPTAEQVVEWRKAAKLPDDAEFAKDPLQALTDERELIKEIERLEGPIRFTPADPVHSRRQFYFSDVSALDKKDRLRHDRQTADVEIAVQDDNHCWHRVDARLHFTAPRLLRDQLNNTSGKDAAFQQAMMTALGLSAGLRKTEKGKVCEATFAECAAVALMPEITADGKRRILLNFPIKLENDAIARQLGKADRWDAMQFGGADKESYWLRWPTTWHDEKKERKKALPAPWWKNTKPFRCLSADLGQRDTAAFAVIEASPGQPPKPGQSRKLGNDGNKDWWATVRATGVLRLPGEDARVRRDGQWQEEFSGERGRLATVGEWQEARDICEKLGFNPDKILGPDPKRHSFPELNDQLLYALRRAQARLARLQSWSCIESNAKRKEAIAKQLKAAVEELKTANEPAERDALTIELQPLIEREDWRLVAHRLIQEVERIRALLPRELERVANRIQPLRERRWEWALRDGTNYILRQTERGSDGRKKLLAGQRGLSIERIEQLESLRQRCQSLNRALRQTPGQPANLGRSKHGIELPDPCPELLDRLNSLKEQRVNQTAHLILAQALGVRLRAHQADDTTRAAQNIHGEYERIPDKHSPTGFREPVDFIVLENLDRYLASQGRSRGENSKLMKWCHRASLGKLKQLCEPYGLRVLETPAAYSSRFCSLTGVAGFRAVELTPENKADFRWKKHLDRPEAEASEESKRVQALFRKLEQINQGVREANPDRPKWRTLLAPVAGGPIFVPASATERFERRHPKTGELEPAIRFKEVAGRRPAFIQSDINAAINLGLRALSAPNAGDIQLRIRAARHDDSFIVRAENLREKARWGETPPKIIVPEEKDCKKLLAEARLNFFADVGGVADYDLAEVDGKNGFASGRGIWGTIKGNDYHIGKDWKRCQEINAARVALWSHRQTNEDNVPM